MNELFGLVADGLFTEDDFVTNDKGDLVLKEGIPSHTFNSVRPGDIKYVDIDGDGSITNKDEVAWEERSIRKLFMVSGRQPVISRSISMSFSKETVRLIVSSVVWLRTSCPDLHKVQWAMS